MNRPVTPEHAERMRATLLNAAEVLDDEADYRHHRGNRRRSAEIQAAADLCRSAIIWPEEPAL